MEAKLKPARRIAAETRAAHHRWLMQRETALRLHDGTDIASQRPDRHALRLLRALVGALMGLR